LHELPGKFELISRQEIVKLLYSVDLDLFICTYLFEFYVAQKFQKGKFVSHHTQGKILNLSSEAVVVVSQGLESSFLWHKFTFLQFFSSIFLSEKTVVGNYLSLKHLPKL
jgi:hypothetical protein